MEPDMYAVFLDGIGEDRRTPQQEWLRHYLAGVPPTDIDGVEVDHHELARMADEGCPNGD